MGPQDEIEGLVICRVGDHRLAFPASGVASIAEWEGAPAAMARHAFGLASAPGKMLRHEGASLVVDALEIVAERAKLLPVPSLLRGGVGGALRGFVAQANALIPLLELVGFARFLSTRQEGQA